MSTTTVPSDTLPSNVPKLDHTGANWAIWAYRFEVAVTAKRKWRHFGGKHPRPTFASTTLTPDEQAAVDQWDEDENTAKYLLTQRIPDSTVMRIKNLATVALMWKEIVTEYTEKGAYAQTELRTNFLESKCPDHGNVKQFLEDLRTKKEELASVGVTIDDKDYVSTILSSLPYSLSNFASNILAAAKVATTSKTIDPNALVSLISEEYERQKAQNARRRAAAKSTRASRDDDEAMAVAPASSGKSSGGSSRGGKGSMKPKGVLEKPKSGGSANAVVDWDSDSEGVFGVDEMSDTSSDGMPSLESVSNSSEEGSVVGDEDDGGEDWFSDVEEDSDSPWYGRISDEESSGDESESSSFFAVDSDLESVDSWEFIPDHPEYPAETVANVSDHSETIAPPRKELFDSGSTRHISPYLEDFENFAKIPPKKFVAANKQTFSAVGKGDLVIEVPNGVDVSKLRLTEVLYSPEVGYTLVSIGRLDENGYSATFGGGECTIRSPDGERVGRVPKNDKGLYRVVHESADVDSVNSAVETLTVMEMHRRMGHISPETARKLVEKGLVTGVRLDKSADESVFCESCTYAKATRKPVAKVREGERAAEFGGEVHTDVWGPAPVATIGGKKYYITFTDDKTRYTHLYTLKAKSDSFDAYKTYEAWCDTQHSAKVKVLHSDRGGEYLGKEFTSHLKSKGTKQKLTVHDTPQHNGVAERRNRTIVERIRALLHASGLPRFLWGEAARHVVWLMNRTTTKALDGTTPYEALHHEKPNLRGIREWGSKVWVRLEKGTKLGGRVKEGRWMGVDDRSAGYRVYWPDKKNISVERNVYWDENAALSTRLEGEEVQFDETTAQNERLTGNSKNSNSAPIPAPVPSIPEDNNPPPPLEPLEPMPTRSRRERRPSSKVADILAGKAVSSPYAARDPKVPTGVQLPKVPETAEEVVLEGEGTSDWMMVADDFLDEFAMALEMADVDALEPRTLAEARGRPDWPQWEEAIFDELKVLQEAGTWELVERPEGVNIVGSKWVFRAKKDAAGNVVRYKARLVAQGFSQVPGVDYFDTFAPVAKLASIRAVLAMAARLDMELHQIDIKGAYLNGELTSQETIYMKQPPGYPAPNSSNKVCHLLKTLYGLKQSGRRWYQKLIDILVRSMDFLRSEVDQAVFFRRKRDALMIVVVHVDDCTLAATSLKLIENFKAEIRRHVEITDLGELHWLLGIEIKRDREKRTVHMCQRAYIDSILRRYSLEDLKPVSTPMETQIHLSTSQSPSTSQEYAVMRDVPYREAVGSLMYASLGTRPDISFAVSTLSRFSTNPGPVHWNAVKRVFRYLKGTRDLWLTFGEVKKVLAGYADADGSMAEDRHAVSGYAFLIDGGAVSWSSKRQEIISLSTTESEYIAATHAAKEALWLRSLIGQIFFPFSEPTTLFSDNQSAIALTQDHQYHARTKHIDVRFHFIRWIVEEGSLRLIYCPTDDMVADTLTKALPSAKVKHFASELGLRTA